MFINQLRLQNFRSHRDTTLAFDRLTIIRGPHGAGKSSIQMAIEYVLTNRCDITDAGGKGAQMLITQGVKELAVEAQGIINGARVILSQERTASGGTWTAGMATGKAAAATIEKHLAPITVISAVLNAHRFLEMSPNEQRDLLARALASDPVKLDPNPLLNGLTDGYVRSAADIDRLHKHFFELRADANRRVKDLGEEAKPEPPQGMPNAADVQQTLRERQQERLTKGNSRIALVQKYENDRTQFEAATAQKEKYDKDFLGRKDLDAFKKIADNAGAAKKLDTKIDGVKRDIHILRDVIAFESSRLEDAEGQPLTCSVCGQALPFDIEGARKRLQESIDVKTKKLQEIEKELTELQSKRADLGDYEHAQQKLDLHFAAGRACTAADEVLKKGEPIKPDTAKLDEEIKDLDERIARGNQVLQQVTEYEARLKLWNERVAKKQEHAGKALQYEQMVEYFGPKSLLRAKLVAGKIVGFHRRVNEVLHRFNFEFDFELETDVEFHIMLLNEAGTSGIVLPLRSLSESEQYRFSIALQIALAEATGVGLVVIDRADILLPKVRQQLTAELESSRLEQAIVLSAGELTGNYPQREGVKFIELSNESGVTVVQEAAYATAD